MFSQTWAAAGGIFQRAFSGTALALGGLTFVGVLAATPASAAEVLIDSVKLESQTYGVSTDPLRPINYMTPFVVTSAGLDPFLAFCIQYDIDMPIDGAHPELATTINTIYVDQPDLLGANGAAVGQLVNYGTSLFKNPGALSATDLSLELSVIQGAIWTITTGHTFGFYPDYYEPTVLADLNAKIVTYATGGQPTGFGSGIRTVVSKDRGVAQGLAFAGVAPVPEPGAWALMIGGFFAAGSLVRRAQRRSLAAA